MNHDSDVLKLHISFKLFETQGVDMGNTLCLRFLCIPVP